MLIATRQNGKTTTEMINYLKIRRGMIEAKYGDLCAKPTERDQARIEEIDAFIEYLTQSI